MKCLHSGGYYLQKFCPASVNFENLICSSFFFPRTLLFFGFWNECRSILSLLSILQLLVCFDLLLGCTWEHTTKTMLTSLCYHFVLIAVPAVHFAWFVWNWEQCEILKECTHFLPCGSTEPSQEMKNCLRSAIFLGGGLEVLPEFMFSYRDSRSFFLSTNADIQLYTYVFTHAYIFM